MRIIYNTQTDSCKPTNLGEGGMYNTTIYDLIKGIIKSYRSLSKGG